MKYILTNIITFVLIVVGIFSTNKMNVYWLLGEILLWFVIHVFLLKREWKYFYKFIKNAFIVYVVILFLFGFFALNSQNQTLISLIRILNIGIITMLFLVPVVTDSFLITTRKLPILSYFFEAFILIRNFISGLADDLMLGILTAPNYKNNNVFSKGKFLAMASFTLIARTPDIITNLLVSTKLSNFEVHLMKNTTKFSYAFYISIIICLIFFSIQIISYYGYI